ncbi:MAG: hypothetical protein Q7J61_02325 [Deltaproteobacteria bacterium]|nr:hypothetical protein [Deltaproteobacteria bacterium]
MDGSPQPSKKLNLPYIFAVKLRPAPERRAGLFLVLFLALVFSLPSTVQAGKLEGTVIGRKGDLKKYVRISLFGREPKTTFTDDKGIFTLDAPDGRYGLSISEKGNEQTFEVEIPGRWRFRVDW